MTSFLSVINIITIKKNLNSSSNIKLYDTDNSLINDPEKIANIFNQYFSTIGTKLSEQITSNSPNQEYQSINKNTIKDSLFLNPISITEMKEYIKKLNPNKSSPKHSVPTKIIKLSTEILAPVITKIFNICISQGIFPEKLKAAEIRPIYKNGDKCQTNNHRPISILSPFSKLYEYHLQSQLTKFLDKNKILHKFQFGFRTNSSTEMAITQITEEIINNLQNNKTTCAIFLDLKKAFDCVDHKIMLTKLYNYGVRGLPFKLFTDYLTNRTQQTIINGHKSTPLPITCGVPQGSSSILGPPFFNVYINDIISSSNFNIKLFADDACLTYSSNNTDNLQTTINHELNNINKWRISNKLSINFSKSNYMVFTRKKTNLNLNLTMEDNKLIRVNKIKYLGVILDEKLNWKDHINYLTNKISKSSYIISKIRHYVDLPLLNMLYYSMVHPHLIYCVTVWGGAPLSILKPLTTL